MNSRTTGVVVGLLLTALVAWIWFASGDVYTLYRNSVLDENARYHVATFNAGDGEKYNQGNCNTAAALFQTQPGVKTRFWCEKGRFRR